MRCERRAGGWANGRAEGRAQGEVQPGESRIQIRSGEGRLQEKGKERESQAEGEGAGELWQLCLAACFWPPEEAEAEGGVHLGQLALGGSFLELVVLGGDLQLVLFEGQTGALSPPTPHSAPAAARPPTFPRATFKCTSSVVTPTT